MKRVYRFGDGDVLHPDLSGMQKKAMYALLGGKGAALQTMCQIGLPVPPGFTITTEVCNAYRAESASGKTALVEELLNEVQGHMVWLQEQFGYLPLVSVRSGAPVSMPGMMDTILNVGLCNANFDEWVERIGARATHDSDRRLTQMLGSTAYGVPAEVFEFQLAKVKKEVGAKLDTDLDTIGLSCVIAAYRKAFEENKGFAFPFDAPLEQLRAAVVAVFDSWMNPRAIEYRKLNKIDEAMGTAVTVQAMVFGNMGEDSGSGVLFSRDPSTGEAKIMGEYLANAQGEDVVAGIRTPENLDKYLKAGSWAKDELVATEPWAADLVTVVERLEQSYADMVDIEFTVQKGKLFVLQSRVGKRSARAAFKIAYDLVKEGVLTPQEALGRVTLEQFKIARRPGIDPKFKSPPDYVGLPACPGVATGVPVFSSEDAVNCTVSCVLVTHETTPDDIAGMAKAVGVLTQTGGATSHAAVVARAMDKACVVGCTSLVIDNLKGVEKVTIDGGTGRVWVGTDVPVVDSSDAPELKAFMGWCMESQGFVEQAVTDLEGDRPHRIVMSHWWGDGDVLDAVLDGLAERDSRKGIVLDCMPPSSRAPACDSLLRDCFVDPSDPWPPMMLCSVFEARTDLAGLTLANLIVPPKCVEALRGKGYILPVPPRRVSDLLSGAGEPDQTFIEKVIGGPDAWMTLQQILQQAGYSMSVTPTAVPPDYAVFRALAK